MYRDVGDEDNQSSSSSDVLTSPGTVDIRNGDCCFGGEQGSGQLDLACEAALGEAVGDF